MPVDMFIKIGDIDGESRDAGHAKEIDVLSWSWGASRSGTIHSGGGGAGKGRVRDLSLTKYVDAASPELLQHVFDGRHVKEARLVVRKGGTPLEYITITMKDVIVSAVDVGGSAGEDRLTENVTLNFSSADYEYVPQKKDGSKGSPKKARWDSTGKGRKRG